MADKDPGQLQEHMLGTYYSLRVGLAAIGFALPLVVLFSGGFLHEVWFEGSISRYYYTVPVIRYLVTRDLFVGGLLAAAACLYLYKGYSTRENVVLNIGAVFATLVAVLPTARDPKNVDLVGMIHGTSAVLFFVCIAFVSLFHSRDTLELVPEEKKAFFTRGYTLTGAAMLLFPLVAVMLAFVLESALRKSVIIYVIETLGIWAFCAYWALKTYEMRISAADRRALDRELARHEVVDAETPVRDLVTTASPPGQTGKRKRVERIVPAGISVSPMT